MTAALVLGSLAGQASATGPGGWDHVGNAGTPGTSSLNGAVHAVNGDDPSKLYVGGASSTA